MRANLIGTVMLLSLLFFGVAADVAAACGRGTGRIYVVAHGRSPDGVPWHVSARPHKRWLEFHWLLGARAHKEVGFNFSMAGHDVETLSAGTGKKVDNSGERDLSGVTSGRVAMLVIHMTDGSTFEVHPEPAPRRLRQRFCWLRGMRFFEAFFTSGKPRRITVLDADGNVLGQANSEQGTFDVLRPATLPRPL